MEQLKDLPCREEDQFKVFTSSVKANRKGEYISCPKDQHHLAPSPMGTILR